MPRARTLTVPRSARPDQTTRLNRQLRRWLGHEFDALRPALARSARACDADRYRKHFAHGGHACLLLFHGLGGGSSLRQSYAAFADCPGLLSRSGLAVPTSDGLAGLGVSFSQVAASTTSRPAAFLAGLVPGLVARLRQHGRLPASLIPLDLHVLDSTFVRLALALAPWLPSRGGEDAPGLRVQVLYQPAADLPEHLVITDTRTPDCRGLDAAVLDDPARLATLRDQTLAIDLGYYAHARFVRLRAAGVHFVCPRHPQAKLTIVAEAPVQPPLPGLDGGRITILTDHRVTIGSAENRRGAVLPGLRCVTADVPARASARRRQRATRSSPTAGI